MSLSQILTPTDINRLRTRTTIYVALLELLSLDLSSQEARDIKTDLIIGRLLIRGLNKQRGLHAKDYVEQPILTHDELISLGLPQQRHLSSSLQKQLLNEVQSTIIGIESFLLAEDVPEVPPGLNLIPSLHGYREALSSLKDEIEAKTGSIKCLLPDVDKLRQSLHAEIERLLDTTPSSIACHSAQGEFWSTTIESALIKLSLLQAQTERQLYNHTIRGQGAFSDVPFATVSQALEAAHKSLRGQEHDMVTEARALDEQLQAYTALLELVDGGKKGAYKQIVDDWTKIKQDTDECLRDLRRLGWTGE
ncbi:hypothetical protein BJ165DRAFT_1607121 [Panaeolus papilionaceus]|nr:hypothetical protein BJ165DRAFT_1607121 [Panaeolus papilionaceus]